MSKRKVSKESTYNKTRQRIAEDVGLSLEGKPWTNEQMDVLLDGFLVHEWKYLSTRACFASECHRSQKAIEVHLWKLFTRDQHGAARDYQGDKRIPWDGAIWTDRDHAVLEAATGPVGIKQDAYSIVWIGRILARPALEISDYLQSLVERGLQDKRGRGFGLAEQAIFDTEVRAKLTHKTLKGMHKKVMESL